MQHLKKIPYFSVVILSLVFLSGCFEKPSFSPIPDIGFYAIGNSKTAILDTLDIVIDFKDGDGNLGITSEERQVPTKNGSPDPCGSENSFQEYFYTCNDAGKKVDSTYNQFYYNYFVRVFKGKADNTAGEEIIFPDPKLGYSGAFEPLYELDGNGQPKTGPLQGTIQRRLVLNEGTFFKKKDLIKFKIKIVDRDGNFSQEIETDTIRLFNQ